MPRNYFCNWEVNLNYDTVYTLSILRSNKSTPDEELQINIHGYDSVVATTDRDLLPDKDQGYTWSSYILVEASKLDIYARNINDNSEGTFEIRIEIKSLGATTNTMMNNLVLIAMCSMTCCMCFMCCAFCFKIATKQDRRAQIGSQSAVEAFRNRNRMGRYPDPYLNNPHINFDDRPGDVVEIRARPMTDADR